MLICYSTLAQFLLKKRLSMENGRFLSDSSFNLLPRTFNQIGFSSQNNQLQLIYITSMTLPDTTEKQYFNEGSILLGSPIPKSAPLVDLIFMHIF